MLTLLYPLPGPSSIHSAARSGLVGGWQTAQTTTPWIDRQDRLEPQAKQESSGLCQKGLAWVTRGRPVEARWFTFFLLEGLDGSSYDSGRMVPMAIVSL